MRLPFVSRGVLRTSDAPDNEIPQRKPCRFVFTSFTEGRNGGELYYPRIPMLASSSN